MFRVGDLKDVLIHRVSPIPQMPSHSLNGWVRKESWQETFGILDLRGLLKSLIITC